MSSDEYDLTQKKLDDLFRRRFEEHDAEDLYQDVVFANHARVAKYLKRRGDEDLYELVAAYIQAERREKSGMFFRRQTDFNWDVFASTEKMKEVFG